MRGTHQRKTLEWSCRYVARPAVVGERLSLTQQGNVRLASSMSEIQNGGSEFTSGRLEQFLPTGLYQGKNGRFVARIPHALDRPSALTESSQSIT